MKQITFKSLVEMFEKQTLKDQFPYYSVISRENTKGKQIKLEI